MDYCKQQLKWTRSPTFRGAEPLCRGVWTSLNGYCAQEENGGRIVGCKTWSERKWGACADVTSADITATVGAELAQWDGNDLIVIGYDLTGEHAFQAARLRNKGRATSRWQAEKSRKQGNKIPPAIPAAVPPAMPPASRDDAGGIENGYRRQCPSPSPSPSPSPLPFPGDRARAFLQPGTIGQDIADVLDRHFLHVSPRSVQEWLDLAQDHAQITRTAEQLACIDWVVTTVRAAGKTVEYAKHCVQLAKPENRERWRRHAREAKEG